MKGFNNPHDGVMDDGVTLIDPYHHSTFEAGGQEMLRCLKKSATAAGLFTSGPFIPISLAMRLNSSPALSTNSCVVLVKSIGSMRAKVCISLVGNLVLNSSALAIRLLNSSICLFV